MGVIRGSSYYQLVPGSSWGNAESQARKLGGNLVAINDAYENQFLSDSFKDKNLSYYGGKADKDIYWIGLTKQNGSWQWSNGERLSYSNWGPMEPYEDSGYWDRGEMIVEAHGGGAPWARYAGAWNNNSFPISPLGRYGIAEIPLAYFSISDAEIEEGGIASVEITRTGNTGIWQTLILATSDGSAVEGDDYKRKTKTITFAAGETSKTVNIVTNEDINFESDETIKLTLSATSGDAVPAQIQNGSATLTIKNDDLQANRVTFEPLEGKEGEWIKIKFRREGDLSQYAGLHIQASSFTSPKSPSDTINNVYHMSTIALAGMGTGPWIKAIADLVSVE